MSQRAPPSVTATASLRAGACHGARDLHFPKGLGNGIGEMTRNSGNDPTNVAQFRKGCGWWGSRQGSSPDEPRDPEDAWPQRWSRAQLWDPM